MRVLITGAAGFIGQLVAAQLLNDPKYIVVLTDHGETPIPRGVLYPENAKVIKADLSEEDSYTSILSNDLDVVYAFHGIMSSGSEANFELGMQVNVKATMKLLEALRKTCPGIRVIYTSSLAVYGQPLPNTVDDTIIPTPQSSYGNQKMICETLINDYTRRGYIAGFSLRLPSIVVRSGKPTAAASSFLSGMVREPFNGVLSIIPIKDRSFSSWVCSPRTLVYNLLYTLTIPSDALPSHIRQINMPGISVTIQEIMDAVAKVGGENLLKLMKEENNDALIPILKSWATSVDNTRALKLGFKKDICFEDAVRDFKETLDQCK